MQIIKSVITLIVFFYPAFSFAQTTFLPEGSKEYQTIDRMEIKYGHNTDIIFPTIKPYSRKTMVKEAEFLDSINRGNPTGKFNLTPVDKYDLNSLLMGSSEWVTGSKQSFLSNKPIWKTFYVYKPNFIEEDTTDFFVVANPVIYYQQGHESGSNANIFINKRGVTVRGRIAKRIGFSTTMDDNQERGPSFFGARVDSFHAVPGAGFYKSFKTTAYDYFDARGYFTANATKYIDIQFGYDRNFIGNGYRSLFLDDEGNSYLFLKLNTRIWKLNYENLFMELVPQFVKNGDSLVDRKYAAMHHLSMDVTKWLNIGLFESVVFARKNNFDLEYLNPIIFLRYVEGDVGSPDKAHVGFDFKANAAHRFQFYGQFLLDEFILHEIIQHNGYWANKYGYQLGAKYVDAFNIKNLDLQIESNRVRPFVYSHYDSVANYTHYNQPLADILGANFQEFIGILKYQPAPKWYINARAIYYYQGLDSAGIDYGSNPFESYTSRTMNYGYYVGSGRKVQCFNTSFVLSYEIRENLFIEGTDLFRKYTGLANSNTFSIGVRWNAQRRDYDY